VRWTQASAGEVGFGYWLRVPWAGLAITLQSLNLVAHKVGPALAVGNTVVLKPASTTPLTAIVLAEILEAAGAPPGVFTSVARSGGTVASGSPSDPAVSKISFTGRPPSGADHPQGGTEKVTMEAGNNSGTIIEPDADLPAAVPRCVMSSFANSGSVHLPAAPLRPQGDRQGVHEAVRRGDEEAERGNRWKGLRRGPDDRGEGADPGGEWVKEAVREGAQVFVGGKREGRVMQPTGLVNVRAEMKVMCRRRSRRWSRFTIREVQDAVAMSRIPVRLQRGLHQRPQEGDVRQSTGQRGRVMINDTSIFRVDHMPTRQQVSGSARKASASPARR